MLATFPDLAWSDAGAGQWSGVLPVWPFERANPGGALMAETGLDFTLDYPEAYPMVPPQVWPKNPEPALGERTMHKWHTNGDGSLCLLQNASLWSGRETVVGLLMKAAGWRVEYALVKADLASEMSSNGIVSDASRDESIAAWLA